MLSIYSDSRAASDVGMERICFTQASVARFGLMIRLLLALAVAVQSRAFLIKPSARAKPWAPRTRSRTSHKMALDLPFDFTRSPSRWKDEDIDSKPGFGGIWPGDPNAVKHHVKWVNKEGETMAAADVPEDRYLFHATEEAGMDIPIINKSKMCRQGCCTTCAVKVLEGKVKPEGALGLLKDLRQEGYTLSCCSYPRSDLVLELQEEDEVYIRQFGENFEGGGVEWGGFLPEED